MSNVSKKWEKISESCYGDFLTKRSGTHFGYVKENNTYYFGEFDENKKPNGINVFVQALHSRFGKWEKGQIKYPYVEVDFEGNLKIAILKKDDLVTELDVNLSESSFELYRIDSNREKQGYATFYDGLTSSFVFRKYSDDEVLHEVKVPKKFLLTNPIKSDCKLDFPGLLKYEDIEQTDENDKCFQVSFKPRNHIGLGFASWDDGNNSICRLVDGVPNGYQMYNYPDYFTVFHADGSNFDGPKVQFDDDGTIYITVSNSKGKKQTSSAIISICGEELVLADSSTGAIEKDDLCARIRYLSEISFSKEEDSWTDFYYAMKLFDEQETASQPKKATLDTNDPEYKMENLVGQEEAKKEFKRIKAYVQKNPTRSIFKNIVFSGENGVGKSTVAKLISEILYKYDAVSRKSYVERSAKELFDSTTGATAHNLESLYDEGNGGVILIDDLHYLEGMNVSNVKEGLMALSNIMSRDTGTVFVLCDNKYNMSQIIDNNTDLFQDKIRFRVNFKDFSRSELEQILYNQVKDKGYTIEKDAMEKLLDVIFLSKSYGNNINAKAAISILEEIIIIQNVRTELVDDKNIIKDDVDVYVAENDIAFIDQKTGYQSEARKKLDELVGLEKIKETVDDLIAYFSINRGKKVDFHMCFTGNPGTGKTEVARIIGKLLRQEGILGTSKFLEVTRRDLVGQYIGQSAIITRDIIDKAMGGVLYIDEAYSLAYGGERDFGPEVIAELLKAMEDRRGEFCVVLAGYTSEMKKLFDLNPGFRSRIKFELEFPDYND